MSSYYEVIAISSDEEGLKRLGEKENIRVFSAPLTRKITLFQDVKALYILYKFLKKEKPNIVHSHTPKAGIIGMTAAFLARVPNRLHTVAGLPLMETNGLKRILLNNVEKLTYSFSTKVYPNSQGLNNFIVKEGLVLEKKLKIIGNGSSNGVDTSFFSTENIKEDVTNSLKRKLKINEEDFVYLFVGRIVKDKGINELVLAFKELNEKYKKTKLLLVGPFEEDLDPINIMTKEIMNQNVNIITTGYQEDVRPYFTISNVLAFPSYREGFPNVVMQASSMGVPSIVTDINGCNELIKHGYNGSIIPVKSKEDLYDEMKFFYETPKDIISKMGKVSRKEMKEKYERKVIWEALLKEYKSLDNV